jgi:HSP20 family molecular chaperone IbpA
VSERQVGQFERTFTFLAKVDQDGVKASLNHGILSIVVPKAIHTARHTKQPS